MSRKLGVPLKTQAAQPELLSIFFTEAAASMVATPLLGGAQTRNFGSSFTVYMHVLLMYLVIIMYCVQQVFSSSLILGKKIF